MNEIDLLKSWPGWAKANAETILASPAWRIQFMDGTLRRIDGVASAMISLDVAFDDEPAVLTLGDSTAFAELHELLPVADKVPDEIKLALVEKECGAFLQALEDLLRRRLSIRGISRVKSGRAESSAAAGDGTSDLTSAESSAAVGETVSFVWNGTGGASFEFSLPATSYLKNELGKLENLDPAHESIAGMKRRAVAVYAEYATKDVAAGDILLIRGDEAPRWTLERGGEPTQAAASVDAELLQVMAPEAGELKFAEIAIGKYPPIPAVERYRLSNGLFAERVTLCGHPAYRVVNESSTTAEPSNG